VEDVPIIPFAVSDCWGVTALSHTPCRLVEYAVQSISKQMSTVGSINDHVWRTVVKDVPNFIEGLSAKCHEVVGYPISIHSFIHLFRSHTTGPQPLPKRVLHRVRSSASCFSVQSLLVSLKSSSSCLRLLPCLSVTSIIPSIFPSITCLEDSSYVRFDHSSLPSLLVLYVGYSFPL